MESLKSVKWYEGKAILEETTIPPIPPKHVLAKVLSTLIYSPYKNRNVLKNMKSGRTLGSFGIVKIVEPGVETNVMPGEVYGVEPYTTYGILGLDVDGLASEYTVIPKEALVSLKGIKPEKVSPLHVEFGYIHELTKLAENSSRGLIIGCGFTAYVLGLIVKNYRNTEILCLNTEYLKSLRDLGLPLKKDLENLKDKVDLLVLTEDIEIDLRNLLRDSAWIYITPGTFTLSLHYYGIPPKIKLVRPKTFKPKYSIKFLNKISPHIIESQIKIVNELSQVIEALSLFERVLVNFRKEI
ncbi:MAG: hypothetical protein QN229_03440 [Desulfurococcaceae archaeon TW002]